MKQDYNVSKLENVDTGIIAHRGQNTVVESANVATVVDRKSRA